MKLPVLSSRKVLLEPARLSSRRSSFRPSGPSPYAKLAASSQLVGFPSKLRFPRRLEPGKAWYKRSRRSDLGHMREISTLSVPAVLIPPLIFFGLLLSLWFYKCVMLVLFQNKIIYMPGVPLFARKEKIADYQKRCLPVKWHEERIVVDDGTEIGLCVGSTHDEKSQTKPPGLPGRHLVVVYFQGNASSLPPRLPELSEVIKMLEKGWKVQEPSHNARCTFVGVSYRGYWTSRGRPSQWGIERDASAALNWIEDRYGSLGAAGNLKLVLWGQSIGAGVVTVAAAQSVRRHTSVTPSDACAVASKVRQCLFDGLILETPFTSVQDMLVALYPQRWLPYRYLGGFLRSWWDSREALTALSRALLNDGEPHASTLQLPHVLILQAGLDEVVPSSHGQDLERLCKELGFPTARKIVRGALHSEALLRSEGRVAVKNHLLDIT